MKLALLCTAVVLLGHQGYCQDDLDKLRKNIPGEPGKDYPIYGTNILCKINPQNPGCGGGGGGGGAARGNNGNGGKNGANGGGNRQNQSKSRPAPQQSEMKPAANAGGGAAKNGNGNRRNGGGNNRRNNGAGGNKKPGNQNQGGGRNNGGNQPSEGGDELDALRKNIPGEPGKDYPIFGTNILCKINPQNPGCGGGGSKARSGRQNGDYQAAIARGEIPGTPGKDYPVNSLDALRKKGFGNIELAPASLITPDYPGLAKLPTSTRKLPPPANRKSGSGGRNNRRSQGGSNGSPRSSNGGGRKQQQSQNNGGGSYCPGGSLQACIGFCPSDNDGSEYGKCVEDCGNNC